MNGSLEVNFSQTEYVLEEYETVEAASDLKEKPEEILVVVEEIDETDNDFYDVIENVGNYVSDAIGELSKHFLYFMPIL